MTRRIVTVMAGLALAAGIAAADEAVEFGGHRYRVFDEVDELSWHGARDACAGAGGTLAVVTSAEEADFIAGLCDGRYLFLGATDEASEGDWRWVDGSPWSYRRWMKGQPNDYGGVEDFLATYDDGAWVDVEAAGDDFWMPTGYICEWSE